MTAECRIEMELLPHDNRRLANLCGPLDDYLHLVASAFAVKINRHGQHFSIAGPPDAAALSRNLLESLYAEDTPSLALSPTKLKMKIQEYRINSHTDPSQNSPVIQTKRLKVTAKTANQGDYLSKILTHNINFATGPAGTGKTFLAVACAVQAYLEDEVQRIVLVRPAVEAGEKLGFLPGDIAQKVDPYLRPIYDALYEMLTVEKVTKLIERNIIEIAPLAFMRGRTLNEAFVILDEAQNTTPEQMKMFLTRIGFGTTAVITGDLSQTDLPNRQLSGLKHALSVLQGVEGISVTEFQSRDVVRHEIVQRIVEAYDKQQANETHD